PTRGSGQELFKISRVGSGRVKRVRNITGRVGSGQEVLKYRGSGRVGSRFFQISRVGLSWVIGGFQISRVGSGHDPRDTDHVTGRATLTREFFSSDPRTGPADLTRGPDTLKTYCFLPEGLSGTHTPF
ncbi:unnamed protein product, partial [Laminaria digitata]